MKKNSFILGLIIIITVLVCGAYDSVFAEKDEAYSYLQIPGITEAEINAIEKLKSEKDRFIYAGITETEAFINENGDLAGFSIIFSRLLTELIGIPFEYVLYDNWEVLKKDIDQSIVDFTGGITATPERLLEYKMTYPIAERSLRIFMLSDTAVPETEADINGLTIGVFTETITAESIHKAYPDLIFNTVEFDDADMGVQLLLSGEADLLAADAVVDPFFADYGFVSSKLFFSLVYTPVSLTTANHELEPLISVINKFILNGEIDMLTKLYRQGELEYMRYKLHKTFTEEELDYIADLAARGVGVRTALEHDNYPICFYNEKDQEFQGIAIDVLAKINELTGIRFDTVTSNDTAWAEIMNMLQLGDAAMVSQLMYTESRARDFIWPGKPYSVSNYALISRSDYPYLSYHQVERARVGTIHKTAYEDMYFVWFPDSVNIISYDTHTMGLDALEQNEIDLLMASEYILLTQLNYREKSGFKINLLLDNPMESYFGFNKNEEILCSIIEKAQACIDIKIIEKTWKNKVFDYSKKLADQRSEYFMAITALLMIVLMIFAVLLLRNKHLSKELGLQSAVVSTIYSSIPEIVFSMDQNYVYTSCNNGFAETIGVPKESIIGKTNKDIFAGNLDLVEAMMISHKQALEAKEPTVIEEYIPFPNGDKRLFETIMAPLTQNGKTTGLMGISRDITKHKAAEAAAKEASEAKSSFLARISHEIRTPLNAIIGMAVIAKKSVADRDKVLWSVNQIITSSNHLLGILNDVLDMSKIESGKAELANEPFRMLDAYSEMFAIIKQRCEEKNIDFITNIDETEDRTLIGDKLRINQIMVNLLGNAIKFTESGGEINFSVTVAEETDHDILLKFKVSDSGIGMSEKQMSKLFVPFEQADKSITAKYGGTGLGLSISQNLVKMMGGEITAESKPGKGSRFSFEIRFNKGIIETDERFELPDDVDFIGRRILLVEDVDINRMIVADTLEPTGIELTEAENGQQALEIFSKSETGYYDLIFMDVQMPEMDGYDATRAIRALDREDAESVPIIAMTANAYKEDVQKALDSGMDGHLAKPIDIKALYELMSKYLSK